MLLVGAACNELRFPPGLPMAGFAARTNPSVGGHDPLAAVAVAVSDQRNSSLIVVADLTSLAPAQAAELRERVRIATGLPRHAVAITVTHTHSAPNLDPWMTTPGAPSAWAATADTIVLTAIEAFQRRRAAVGSRALGSARLGVNRRRPDGPLDDALGVVRFDEPDGTPIAVVFGYGCHPTIAGPDNLLLSADWPGAARTAIERTAPGVIAMALQGFCGDCNVGHSAHSSMALSGQAERTPAAAALRGQRLGGEVVRLAREATPMLDLVLTDERPWTWRWSAADAQPPLDRGSAASASDRLIQGLVPTWRASLSAAEHVQETLSSQCFRWGDALLVMVSGEPFAALGLEIRRMLPGSTVIPVGYANGVPGYLPTPAPERDLGGYEVEEAHVVYGRPAPIPEAFAAHVREHTRTLSRPWGRGARG